MRVISYRVTALIDLTNISLINDIGERHRLGEEPTRLVQ